MNRRVLSIASNTWRHYLFTPTFIILVVLLLSIPFFCLYLKGDGTGEGKFKMFITYSFLLSSLLLTATNVFLSCLSISSEWKKKTLFLLDVKPISRWEIIIGKWFGILGINLFLIVCFLLSLAVSSMILSRTLQEDFPGSQNIFTTHTEVFPHLAPGGEKKKIYTVPPGGGIEWDFKDIRASSSEVFLKYRFYTSEKEKEETIGYWLMGPPQAEKPFELMSVATANKVQKLSIPSEAISREGALRLIYLNIDPENVSVVFPKKDFRILYPYGNYWINLIKGGGVIFILLAFVSSLGVFFSCLVSTLTALLSTSVLVFISYLHNFIEIIINSLSRELAMGEATGLLSHFSYHLLRFITFFFPPLNEAIPHPYIRDFILLPFHYLQTIFLRIVPLGVLPLLLIAIIYLSRREIGIPNE